MDADGLGGEEVVLRSNFEIGPIAWMANGVACGGAADSQDGFDIDYLSPAGNGRDRVRTPWSVAMKTK